MWLRHGRRRASGDDEASLRAVITWLPDRSEDDDAGGDKGCDRGVLHTDQTRQRRSRFPRVWDDDVMAAVTIPAARWPRWVENFEHSHGPTAYAVSNGALEGAAQDGSTFAARLPFAGTYAGAPDASAFATAVAVPRDWGVLLVRKGGFAVARVAGETITASKVGQRHVQGRTKAGGQSQQRFARRRGNQARQAYEAAADHAARILEGLRGPVVTGGDHAAVAEVLADPRLRGLTVVSPWLAVPDPRRGVLETAVVDASSLQVDVVNA